MAHNYIKVSTALENREGAQKIATMVVEKRLAACAQIVGPITSTYWWKGKIEETEEWLCIIKSRVDMYNKLEWAIKDIHPYEEPEIVAESIITGSKGYLKWLDEEVQSG